VGRRLAGALFWMLALLGSGIAQAQNPLLLRAGIEYRLITPQPIPAVPAHSIEVIDFFWYGCPYCNQLQPALEEWIRRKPGDISVRRIPAVLRESWASHARIYYTLEALGEAEHLHQRVYYSHHVERLQLIQPEVLTEWAVRHGIARERWEQAYHSAEVGRKVEQAAQLVRTYGVTATPTLVVQGRYLTSGNMAGSIENMIPVLDGLIRLAREPADPR